MHLQEYNKVSPQSTGNPAAVRRLSGGMQTWIIRKTIDASFHSCTSQEHIAT
jgi:hypothetical protein